MYFAIISLVNTLSVSVPPTSLYFLSAPMLQDNMNPVYPTPTESSNADVREETKKKQGPAPRHVTTRQEETNERTRARPRRKDITSLPTPDSHTHTHTHTHAHAHADAHAANEQTDMSSVFRFVPFRSVSFHATPGCKASFVGRWVGGCVGAWMRVYGRRQGVGWERHGNDMGLGRSVCV
jgi:hypothetical protein